jgi:hypothetical protein
LLSLVILLYGEVLIYCVPHFGAWNQTGAPTLLELGIEEKGKKIRKKRIENLRLGY